MTPTVKSANDRKNTSPNTNGLLTTKSARLMRRASGLACHKTQYIGRLADDTQHGITNCANGTTNKRA